MAGQYFSKSRNIELSTLGYMETQLNASWTGITTVKTFKDAYDTNIPVPVVCIRLDSTNNARLELGAVTLDNRYLIIIDVFSRSDAQRVDLADFIVNQLKDGWDYNTYTRTSGSSTGGITGTATGKIFVTSWISDLKVSFGEEADPKDRYRHTIAVLVRKSR